MSRIGRKPVPVPPSVKVSIAEQKVDIEGLEGKAELHAPARDRGVRSTRPAGQILCRADDDDGPTARRTS